jgi:NADH:ubiquinone oxidoreductase subunit
MEGSMIGTLVDIKDVIEEARNPGALKEPVTLLSHLDKSESSLDGLATHDLENEQYAALWADFPFLHPTSRTTRNPTPEDRASWACLIRWLIAEITTWTEENDPHRRRLTAVFLVAQASDRAGNLWPLIFSFVVLNPAIVSGLKAAIGKLSVVFGARGGAKPPIWESEAVDKFKSADAQGNWMEIGTSLRLFEHQIFPNTLQMQAIRYLYNCGLNELADATRGIREMLVAMSFASALDPEPRLAMGAGSDNPYVQLASVYQTVSGRYAANDLSQTAANSLASLFSKVMIEPARWEAWMHVFNEHPGRYPVIQIPLGHALATAPEQILRIYVESILLHTVNPQQPNPSRKAIARCLQAFGAIADKEQRSKIWRCAHDCWLLWDFGKTSPNSHLLSIQWSQLDYAVVGYAAECLDEAQLQQRMTDIRNEMQVFDQEWYETRSDLTATWNRLLSKFQPYAHASTIPAGNTDWMPETRTYLPFKPEENEYKFMMFASGA